MSILPAVGEPFTDPLGATIVRLTDCRAAGLAWTANEYSSVACVNCDNSLILLVEVDRFALYTLTGRRLRDLPIEVNASSQPRWSRTNPSLFYFLSANRLMAFTEGIVNVVRVFDEYSKIDGMGESDISVDGRFALAGDKHAVFIYDPATDQCSPVFDTEGHPFDSLYIGRSGVTITYNQSGSERFSGVEFYNNGLNFVRQVARAGGHMDITTDAYGEECLVWANANDPQPTAPNALVKIRLSYGEQATLATFPWAFALHVSCPDGTGFAFAETYDPTGKLPGQIFKVAFDGSGATPLADHRSIATEYVSQPKASVSRDGSLVIFASNWGQDVRGYVDAYALTVPRLGRRNNPPHGVRTHRPVR